MNTADVKKKLKAQRTESLSWDSAARFSSTRILLNAELVISDGAAADRARQIPENAEQLCVISNSLKSAITLEPEVVVAS